MRLGTTLSRVSLAAAVVLTLATAVWWAPFLAFHLLPPEWSGEADRLAELLGLEPGMQVAEIGAGSGALTLAMARRVGERGRVYATELDDSRRAEIAEAAARAGAGNVVVVAARPRESGLRPSCCDAIFMRHVFHHVDGPEVMARQLRSALRDGGRLAVIDFPPDRFAWHLGPDHGAETAPTIEIFTAAGFRLLAHEPAWGGGSYLLLFEPDPAAGAVTRPRSGRGSTAAP